jgi:very-short-patch-repair endonuclease
MFNTQWHFGGTCINPTTGYTLKYDFYLPNHNMCIEFDGKQHFTPQSFGSDKSEKAKIDHFIGVKYRDNIKTQFCVDNNVKLLRIPYTDIDNIDSILSMSVV